MPMLAEMTKRIRIKMQKSQRCFTTTELADADDDLRHVPLPPFLVMMKFRNGVHIDIDPH